MSRDHSHNEHYAYNPDEPKKRADMLRRKEESVGGFFCSNPECKGWVPIFPEMEVNNRNHCPHCLYSKHMDKETPGDRAADCGSRMKPIGLAFKKKDGGLGELSIIHQCLGPDHKISVNRIAADDNTYALEKALETSIKMPIDMRKTLQESGIYVLGERDIPEFRLQIFGEA